MKGRFTVAPVKIGALVLLAVAVLAIVFGSHGLQVAGIVVAVLDSVFLGATGIPGVFGSARQIEGFRGGPPPDSGEPERPVAPEARE